MIRKIHGALPHLLFLVLVFLILQPSVEGTKSYTAFLIIVIAVEAALLANRKKKAAIDIGIIVFAVLILWEYITAKVGVKKYWKVWEVPCGSWDLRLHWPCSSVLAWD